MQQPEIFQPVNGIVQPPVVPPPNRPGRMTNQLQFIQRAMLTPIMKHGFSWPFLKPVDANSDYYKVIKNPMDLGTIKQRLINRYYYSAQECLQDFQLLFGNCYNYYRPRDDVIIMAQTLEKICISAMKIMPTEEVEIEPNVVQIQRLLRRQRIRD